MQVTDEQRLDAEAFIGGIAGTREAEPAGSAPSAADVSRLISGSASR